MQSVPFSEAILVALLGILALAGVCSLAYAVMQKAAYEWHQRNRAAQIAERPWFVRFYEFLNQ